MTAIATLNLIKSCLDKRGHHIKPTALLYTKVHKLPDIFQYKKMILYGQNFEAFWNLSV